MSMKHFWRSWPLSTVRAFLKLIGSVFGVLILLYPIGIGIVKFATGQLVAKDVFGIAFFYFVILGFVLYGRMEKRNKT